MMTFIHASCLPPGATPTLLPTIMSGLTLAGPLQSNQSVRLKDIILPEFANDHRIDGVTALVFDTPCPYDVIFGSDLLL